ncbi:MAG: hypothetical protein M3R29_03090 [Verrucomicrobiota bacterium]|nr:hypothetical protein [Verrucomicrobiota bacterium]
MDHGVFRYDEPYGYGKPRRRINYFAWTIAILLLTGFTFAAWILSFYIFGQPERPDSYRILQKLHKVDPPKRFELTAAPKGEFLDAKTLYDRFSAMGSAELAKTNAELARNYIRNFQQVRGLVPYVVGRFKVMDARALGSYDIFTSGMVALTNAVEHGELLMEHVYPADAQMITLMKQTLTVGLEIKFERTHDLSAVIHAERLNDGRIMLTAMPLLYGTYTHTRGTGTFALEPPLTLNLEAGWPVYKEQTRLKAELHYADYRRESAGAEGPVQSVGLPAGAPPAVAQNELVRVEPAKAVEPQVAQGLPPPAIAAAKPTAASKRGKLAKNQKPTPAPSAVAKAPVIVQKPTTPPPMAIATAIPVGSTPAATKPPIAVAAASPIPLPTAPPIASEPPVLPAKPAPTDSSGALASTAGGGTWKTFPAGKMPLGRLIAASDIKDLADRGLAGERVYLKGQFVVNFSDSNRAVLRPRTRLASAMLHLGGGSATRIIVEFPAGSSPPRQGSVVSRDEARPFEITEVRKQDDGQLNVFAREIMQ